MTVFVSLFRITYFFLINHYIEYSYYSMRAADNYMLHNGPECVLSALATSYYKVKAEYEDSSSSSSSFGQLFAVSALVFTVIA